MKMIEVTVMGVKLELPEFKVCKHCGEETCRLNGWSHPEYCNKCMGSEWYEQHLIEKENERKKYSGMDEVFKIGKVAAVYEGKGKEVFVDYKGNIIKEVTKRPRALGKKDWKID